jgi:hypothetical protein
MQPKTVALRAPRDGRSDGRPGHWDDPVEVPHPVPIPFAFSIPARFTPGQVSGGVFCLDATTARVRLSPPLSLDHYREAHLLQGSLPYSQPNIGSSTDNIPGFPLGNNRISITWPGVNGGLRTDYIIPTGLYGVMDLQLAINYFPFMPMGITSDFRKQLFVLDPISATQQVAFFVDKTQLIAGVIPPGAVVDFLNPGANGLNDSVGPILGFLTTAGISPAGGSLPFPNPPNDGYLAPDPANFAIYSAYVLYCSLCRESYNQGATGQLLFVFNLGGQAPQSVITFNPTLTPIVPVSAGTFSSIDFWFTDDQGNRLSLVNFDASVNINMIIAKMKVDGSV